MRDVVCGGEILWDFFEARPGVYVRHAGGASANAAIVLSRLGLDVALVGAVGEDALGDEIVRQIGREGVDVRAVGRTARPTGIVVVTAGRFSPYRSDAPVSARGVRARWGLVGSLVPEVRDLAVRRLAVDLNVHPRLWPSRAKMRAASAKLVRGASLVKASHADLERLCGAEDAGIAWLRRSAPDAVLVVTRAGGDASAIGGWGRLDVAPRRATARESTGAGDAFTAGVLAVLVRAEEGWNAPEVLTRALRLGHRLGRKAVSRVGATAGLVNLEKIPWR